MSDISRNEICLDVELEGAIPMSVPPADAYILYVERAENAAASAESSATAAAASASAAKISETNAANSAKGAESSATAAAASASAAKTSETNAANSAKGAESSATAAAASASAAKISETNAANSAKGAESSATAAAASASAAKISETNAANSAKGAESSKTAAAASASAAKTSETNAANSATSAESSANKAKDIADSLEGLAGITGIATTDEAIAGVVDNKAMTPLKTKEAIESLVPMQRLIDLIYPVGSIYMSVNSTSPADLFGGTWEAMPAGRVLLAQGTSEWGVEYKAGSTGGEHEHKLSVGEIPQFTPTGTLSSAALTGYQNFWSVTWSDGGPLGGASGIISQSTYDGTPGWVGASTGSQKPGRSSINASHAHKLTFESIGGGSAHNIMQPYLSVFMWKRTA